MAIIIYTNAQSTLTLNGYTFQYLGAGEVLSLSPVNELTSRTNSSNSGLSLSARIDGGVHNLTIVVQEYSADDAMLNNARNAVTPVLFNGSMKRSYIDSGTSKQSTVSLENGSITTQATNADNNMEYDPTKTYVIQFRDAKELF